jgi:hypothetical protein
MLRKNNPTPKPYRFSTIIPVLVCVSLIFLLSRNGFSWVDTAHESMTETAASLLSRMLNDKFDKNYLATLPLDVLEPDEMGGYHTDVSQCASMINTLVNQAERLLHKNEDWSKIMFLMAQATHYIEDLNNPYHCGGDDDTHEEFENTAIFGYWTDEDYDGFQYVKDYRIFAENTCGFSSRYLKFTYKLLQKYDPDYYKKFITPIWKHAVNDILDLWLTILWNGLGDRDYKTYGLPEPKGIRDNKKVRFEKIRALQ